LSDFKKENEKRVSIFCKETSKKFILELIELSQNVKIPGYSSENFKTNGRNWSRYKTKIYKGGI